MRDKNYLSNIKFKDTTKPIEIFCPQKYKDYYLRGQILEFSDNIYDKSLSNGYGYAHYHFKIFALINNDYIKKCNDIDAVDSAFGIFYGGTKREFLRIQRESNYKSAKEIFKDLKRPLKRVFKEMMDEKNKPLEVDINSIGIQESQYLTNSIKNKENIIVVKMDMSLDRVEDVQTHLIIPNYPKRIYQLIAYHLASNSDYIEHDTAGFFYELFGILHFSLDYNFTDKHEYYNLLTKIAEISYEWIETQRISKEYISRLNDFASNIKDRTFPFHDCCYKFFDSLLDELKDKQKITQCAFCGNIFPFHNTRKYCALQTEGKDCGKGARNRRFYIRHKKEILPKARKTTRELRALYREKGIKK